MDAEKSLLENLADAVIETKEFRGDRQVVVRRDRLSEVLEFLKNRGAFDMLIDVTAVDYLNYPDAKDRFGVVYSLLNTTTGERLFIKCFLNEPDLEVPSVVGLWNAANWLEREVYDMFGIRFAGHPDHRRILLPDEFTAFPLRKDYPLRGRGERHNFPVLTRAEG